MATGGQYSSIQEGTTPGQLLWDKSNQSQQEILKFNENLKEVLNRKRVFLTKTLDLKKLTPSLQQLRVVERSDLDIFELNATPSDAIGRLLDFLERCPIWHLHGFMRSLAIIGQPEVIEEVGLNPKAYDSGLDTAAPTKPILHAGKVHYLKQADKDKVPIEPSLMQGILQHCELHERNLMKPSIFNFKATKAFDLAGCYVEVETLCENEQREWSRIEKKDYFRKLGTSCHPHILNLEGDAGTGKTSLLKEYAYSWSKEILDCEQDKHNDCGGHEWILVVYVAGGRMRGKAQDAVEHEVKCKEPYKSELLQYIKEGGRGVLIEFDAFDEVRDEVLKQSVADYTEACKDSEGVCVIISGRPGFIEITKILFDRFLRLKGFTLDQVIEYVTKYMQESQAPGDIDIVTSAISKNEDIAVLLSNPLQAHIFAELLLRGTLTVSDIQSLTQIKLLTCLESYMVRRDIESRTKQKVTDTEPFYMLCLELMLSSMTEIPAEMLEKYGFSDRFPYQAFLSRYDDIDECANDKTLYAFTHQVFLENFAARGLLDKLKSHTTDKTKREALLLYTCSTFNMQGVVEHLFALIEQYEPQLKHLHRDILRATLILQHPKTNCQVNETTDKLFAIQDEIKDLHPSLLDWESDVEERVESFVNKAWKDINNAFSVNASDLQRAGWFATYYCYKRLSEQDRAFVASIFGQQLSYEGAHMKSNPYPGEEYLVLELLNHAIHEIPHTIFTQYRISKWQSSSDSTEMVNVQEGFRQYVINLFSSPDTEDSYQKLGLVEHVIHEIPDVTLMEFMRSECRSLSDSSEAETKEFMVNVRKELLQYIRSLFSLMSGLETPEVHLEKNQPFQDIFNEILYWLLKQADWRSSCPEEHLLPVLTLLHVMSVVGRDVEYIRRMLIQNPTRLESTSTLRHITRCIDNTRGDARKQFCEDTIFKLLPSKWSTKSSSLCVYQGNSSNWVLDVESKEYYLPSNTIMDARSPEDLLDALNYKTPKKNYSSFTLDLNSMNSWHSERCHDWPKQTCCKLMSQVLKEYNLDTLTLIVNSKQCLSGFLEGISFCKKNIRVIITGGIVEWEALKHWIRDCKHVKPLWLFGIIIQTPEGTQVSSLTEMYTHLQQIIPGGFKNVLFMIGDEYYLEN